MPAAVRSLLRCCGAAAIGVLLFAGPLRAAGPEGGVPAEGAPAVESTPAEAQAPGGTGPEPAASSSSSAAEPAERFEVRGDGTVVDRTTGLMWVKDANLAEGKMPWPETKTFLDKMNAGEIPGYGYSDWRLPTIKEFESLADKGYTDPALPPDHPFENVKSDYYWSSSTGHYIADYAWVMDMAYGFVHFDYRSYCNYLHLWPVRSDSPAQ